MYSPKHFKQSDIEPMHALIRANPFATLITQKVDGMSVDHIPLHLSTANNPTGCLSGHLPKANPMWQIALPDKEVIVVFHGPHAYVTPSWYPSKKEHGKVVPTWNYAVVHAIGHMKIVEDADWIKAHLETITDQLEQGFANPWAVSDAPQTFTDKLIDHLVGIEINIDRLEGKWKLSQNKSQQDRDGVAAGLGNDQISNNLLLSELMNKIT